MLGSYGNPDHDDATRIIGAALDAGINLVDTADVYSPASRRKSSARPWPAAQRRRAGHQVRAAHGGRPNPLGRLPTLRHPRGGGQPRRLRTDHIDLYQMHRPDPDTDISETLSALSDLVRTGKVRAIGTSTFPAELIVEAQWAAERGAHQRFLSEEPRYSILTRTIEAAVLPTAQRYGMGVLALRSAQLRLALRPRRPHPRPPGQRGRVQGLRPVRPGQPGQARRGRAAHQAGRRRRAATGPPGHRFRPGAPSRHLGPDRATDHGAPGSRPAGAEVRLSADILDRIDEIVAPGAEVNPADNYVTIPALADKNLRRRG